MTTVTSSGEKKLLEAFRNVVPYRPECQECGNKFFRKNFEEKLKESGILQYADSETELTYMECPNCGTAQDFSL